ncbi:MAG: Tol-Pal system beta propeller repeat protein TolB [Pseudomonadota bacterium]
MNRILFAGALWLFAVPAFAELEITISGGETGAQPIAVVPFAAAAPAPGDLAAVIEADLARTGLFKPLRREDMLETPTQASQVDYKNWSAVGVEHVVLGELNPAASGKSILAFNLLDVVRGESRLAGEVAMNSPSRWRSTAHIAADRIYEKLTGVRGVFDTQIAYVTASGTGRKRLFQVIVADADGVNPVTVASSREPLMSPSWSPDRRRLAYVGFEKGRSAIYLHALATGELRKLTFERGINGAPAWSPDGRTLAVTMSFESNPDIYLVTVDSGQRKRLTEHYAIDTEPAWSPDGKEIAFTSDRGGQPQIYVVSSSGGSAKRLTFEGRQNLCPEYSPDGKSIAMINSDDAGYRVGIMDLQTRNLRVLSDGPLDESPSFAPNGATLIYASQGRKGAELATVSVDGRSRQRLTQSGDVREPSWSPLGR